MRSGQGVYGHLIVGHRCADGRDYRVVEPSEVGDVNRQLREPVGSAHGNQLGQMIVERLLLEVAVADVASSRHQTQQREMSKRTWPAELLRAAHDAIDRGESHDLRGSGIDVQHRTSTHGSFQSE